MDRDMVNCMHRLYQDGKLTEEQLDKSRASQDPKDRLFWCVGDTRHPLHSQQIVFEDAQAKALRFSPGVYELIDAIENQLGSMPKPDYVFGYPFRLQVRAPGDRRPAFLAISYAPAFDPVKQAVREAAADANFVCEVTGDLSTPGDITDQVWQGIRGADAVVADITGKNPNVFYEVGLAHALGKEVIVIAQDAADAPFDIRSHRKLDYDPGDLGALKTQLTAALRAVPARYPHEGPEPRY